MTTDTSAGGPLATAIRVVISVLIAGARSVSKLPSSGAYKRRFAVTGVGRRVPVCFLPRRHYHGEVFAAPL